MKVVVQRVLNSSVVIDDKYEEKINKGLMIAALPRSDTAKILSHIGSNFCPNVEDALNFLAKSPSKKSVLANKQPVTNPGMIFPVRIKGTTTKGAKPLDSVSMLGIFSLKLFFNFFSFKNSSLISR